MRAAKSVSSSGLATERLLAQVAFSAGRGMAFSTI